MKKSKNKGGDAQFIDFNRDDLYKKLFQNMMEKLMEGERSAFLGYEKYATQALKEIVAEMGKNSRNGYYERDLLTGLGLLEDIKVPRDREGDFYPVLLDKNQRSTKPMDELVMSIPGISFFSSLLITSEVGDYQRFSSSKKLCSFAGLVPSVHSSGGKAARIAVSRRLLAVMLTMLKTRQQFKPDC